MTRLDRTIYVRPYESSPCEDDKKTTRLCAELGSRAFPAFIDEVHDILNKYAAQDRVLVEFLAGTHGDEKNTYVWDYPQTVVLHGSGSLVTVLKGTHVFGRENKQHRLQIQDISFEYHYHEKKVSSLFTFLGRCRVDFNTVIVETRDMSVINFSQNHSTVQVSLENTQVNVLGQSPMYVYNIDENSSFVLNLKNVSCQAPTTVLQVTLSHTGRFDFKSDHTRFETTTKTAPVMTLHLADTAVFNMTANNDVYYPSSNQCVLDISAKQNSVFSFTCHDTRIDALNDDPNEENSSPVVSIFAQDHAKIYRSIYESTIVAHRKSAIWVRTVQDSAQYISQNRNVTLQNYGDVSHTVASGQGFIQTNRLNLTTETSNGVIKKNHVNDNVVFIVKGQNMTETVNGGDGMFTDYTFTGNANYTVDINGLFQTKTVPSLGPISREEQTGNSQITRHVTQKNLVAHASEPSVYLIHEIHHDQSSFDGTFVNCSAQIDHGNMFLVDVAHTSSFLISSSNCSTHIPNGCHECIQQKDSSIVQYSINGDTCNAMMAFDIESTTTPEGTSAYTYLNSNYVGCEFCPVFKNKSHGGRHTIFFNASNIQKPSRSGPGDEKSLIVVHGPTDPNDGSMLMNLFGTRCSGGDGRALEIVNSRCRIIGSSLTSRSKHEVICFQYDGDFSMQDPNELFTSTVTNRHSRSGSGISVVQQEPASKHKKKNSNDVTTTPPLSVNGCSMSSTESAIQGKQTRVSVITAGLQTTRASEVIAAKDIEYSESCGVSGTNTVQGNLTMIPNGFK
jgi:hypothetical protein